MNIVIPIIVDGVLKHPRFNPGHIVWYDMLDQRDADRGSTITLRTGEVFTTPLPLDKLDQKLTEANEKFAATIFLHIATEYAQKINIKKPRAKR